MVVIAGDGAAGAVANVAGNRAEPVPDRLAAAVDAARALNLVRRSRATPAEVGREITPPQRERFGTDLGQHGGAKLACWWKGVHTRSPRHPGGPLRAG